MKKHIILGLFLLTTSNLVAHRDARTHYNQTSTNESGYSRDHTSSARQQHKNRRKTQARALDRNETEATVLCSLFRYGLGLFCLPL